MIFLWSLIFKAGNVFSPFSQLCQLFIYYDVLDCGQKTEFLFRQFESEFLIFMLLWCTLSDILSHVSAFCPIYYSGAFPKAFKWDVTWAWTVFYKLSTLLCAQTPFLLRHHKIHPITPTIQLPPSTHQIHIHQVLTILVHLIPQVVHTTLILYRRILWVHVLFSFWDLRRYLDSNIEINRIGCRLQRRDHPISTVQITFHTCH